MNQLPKNKMATFGPPKYGLLIDWETSGSDFTRGISADIYQGISLGAIIFDTETYEEVDSLYRELQFDSSKYQWMDSVEKIHGLTREHLAANGVTRESALIDLLSMMVKWMGPRPGKVLFAGHNVLFDIEFTRQLAQDFGMDVEPFHVKIDTSGISLALTGIYKSDDVFEIFGDSTGRGAHNALEDARLTLKCLQNIKGIFQEGMEVVYNG